MNDRLRDHFRRLEWAECKSVNPALIKAEEEFGPTVDALPTSELVRLMPSLADPIKRLGRERVMPMARVLLCMALSVRAIRFKGDDIRPGEKHCDFAIDPTGQALSRSPARDLFQS